MLVAPRIACLNVHTGLLPGYPGFKPFFYEARRRRRGRQPGQRRTGLRSLSDQVQRQFTAVRAAAVLAHEHALPGAEHQPTLGERDR